MGSFLDKYRQQIVDGKDDSGDDLSEFKSAADRRKAAKMQRLRRKKPAVKAAEKRSRRRRAGKRPDPSRSRAARKAHRLYQGENVDYLEVIQEALNTFLETSNGLKLDKVLGILEDGGHEIDETTMVTIIEGVNALSRTVLTLEGVPLETSLSFYNDFILPVYEQVQGSLTSFLEDEELDMESFSAIPEMLAACKDPEILTEDEEELDEDCEGEDCE